MKLGIEFFFIYDNLLLFQVHRRHSINTRCVHEGRTTSANEGRVKSVGTDGAEPGIGSGRCWSPSPIREPGPPWRGVLSGPQESRKQPSGSPLSPLEDMLDGTLGDSRRPQRGRQWGRLPSVPTFRFCSYFCKWKGATLRCDVFDVLMYKCIKKGACFHT